MFIPSNEKKKKKKKKQTFWQSLFNSGQSKKDSHKPKASYGGFSMQGNKDGKNHREGDINKNNLIEEEIKEDYE